MADGSLTQYDGSAGFLVDSNIWIDCIDAASFWHDWAVDQVQACGERLPLHINLIIYTELLVLEPPLNHWCAVLQPNFTNIDEPNGPKPLTKRFESDTVEFGRLA